MRQANDHAIQLRAGIDYRTTGQRIAGARLNLQRCLLAIGIASHGGASIVDRLDRLAADIKAITREARP